MSYSPVLGRFIQRDPVGYADGAGLYEYVRSSPALLVDADAEAAGPATRTTLPMLKAYFATSSPRPGKCGEIDFMYLFGFPAATSHNPGWLIQEVSIRRHVIDRNGNDVTPSPAEDHYWEAIPFPRDASSSGGTMRREGGVWTVGGRAGTDDEESYDHFRNDGRDDTRGEVSWHATAYFWEGVALPAAFQVDRRNPSGSFPATHDDPHLTPSSMTASHDLEISWDCVSKGCRKGTKVEMANPPQIP